MKHVERNNKVLKDKVARKEYSRKQYLKTIDSFRRRNLKNCFGITVEEYKAILDKQDNKCALCDKDFEGLASRLIHLDHCHTTNRIRGILCMKCNVALGMLGDNEESFIKVLAYLRGDLN